MSRRRRAVKRKKTSFVPRTVFMSALAGTSVIPLCAASCGSTGTVSGQDGGRQVLGVANVGFDGVASAAFDAADERRGSVADAAFSVAAIGFDAEAGSEAGDEGGGDDGGHLGVANIGFDGS
jgi:hypothetical protein